MSTYEPDPPTPTPSLDVNDQSAQALLDPERLRREPINWWCYRFQPVSGRYSGEATVGSSTYRIDLRVDIDQRHANSPVLNVVSADIHQKYSFQWGSRTYRWEVYRSSWVMESPTASWSQCGVTVSGQLRFFPPPGTAYLQHSATLNITWRYGSIRSATLTVRPAVGSETVYQCTKKSNAFRDLALEVDYCASVNGAPTLPSYDTTWHSTRPADIAQRVLTIEEAYQEAGIDVTIDPTHTEIDDSAAEFSTWSPAELHDAMETHFSRYGGSWPKWSMWCLLAGSFDSASVGGIMFDAASAYGGAGDAPERQGCAVFRNHWWWNNLVDGTPTTDSQAAAMRKFLHTYVHEIGHAFNFVHSWNKSRPDSLSWMNYDWRYENRNGADSYWNNYHFQFDDEELMHLRHGDRKAVIPGGDPWASGLHAADPHSAGDDAHMVLGGAAPLELLLRAKPGYDYMEPVIIEGRLRNTSDLPIDVDCRLEPEYGAVAYYIRTPSGDTLAYAPVMCLMTDPETTSLAAAADKEPSTVKGEDRRSVEVRLGFGADGFYFAEPGEYLIRAVYHEPGGMVIPSNVERVMVGRPYTRDEERLGSRYYARETGLVLYLGGSSSPFLQSGHDTLSEVCERFPQSRATAEIASVLATDLARPFHRIDAKNRLRTARDADPTAALKLTDAALSVQSKDKGALTNLGLARVARTKASLMVETRQKAAARKEINAVVSRLKKGGVNQPVLDELQAFAKSL